MLPDLPPPSLSGSADQPTADQPAAGHPAVQDIDSAAHQAWLTEQFRRLVRFSQRAVEPSGGFGYLGSDGNLMPERNRELFVNCRMTYVFSLASLIGVDGAAHYAEHGVAALGGLFHDAQFGGWHASVDAEGAPVPGRKESYGHAFVLLAAAAAASAGIPGGQALLAEAVDVFDRYFWDAAAGLARESFAVDFTDDEPYRGANSNMHSVEALLAAAFALADSALAVRAAGICEFLIDGKARENGWSLPEHYDLGWRAVLDYNRAYPAHPFRPFGSTVGHWFEWARLLVQVARVVPDAHAGADWRIEAACASFDHGVAVGWSADGAEGFVYTLDWDGVPVARDRMHWVVTEAIAAAAALYRATGEPRFHQWYQRLWRHALTYFVEEETGAWKHQLGTDLQESGTVWPGRPDAYHVAGALLIPSLPLTGSLAESILSSTASRPA